MFVHGSFEELNGFERRHFIMPKFDLYLFYSFVCLLARSLLLFVFLFSYYVISHRRCDEPELGANESNDFEAKVKAVSRYTDTHRVYI